MKAILYKIKVYESFLSFNHSMGQEIWEIYIPREHMCINEKAGVFVSEEPRDNKYKTEIEISHKSIDILEEFLRAQKDMLSEVEHIFDSLRDVGLAAKPKPSGLVKR